MRETEPKPRYSFIIPVKDQRELTRDCLLSLVAYTSGALAQSEVLIIDDCGGIETQSLLGSLPPPFRLIRNEENLGFAQSNNRAAREARGELLVLLNNDLVLQRGWLEPMVIALESAKPDRIVGNVQVSRVTAQVDHAGKFFDAAGHPRHFGQFFPELFPWQPPVDFMPFPTVTAACWVLRRSTFLGLDGFDPEYLNGFEDDDLCMRAQQQGIEVGVALESRVYHQVSASEGRKDHEDANAQLFLSRWQPVTQHWHETRFAELLATLRSWAPGHQRFHLSGRNHMSKFFDPAPINERLAHFDVRLDDLLKQFTDYQEGLNEATVRVSEHMKTCTDLISALRAEQEALARRRGLSRWFATAKQKQINSRMRDVMERQLAILRHSWDAQATVPGLLVDTAITLKRDVREVVESVRTSLERLDDEHVQASIARLAVDLEMLKELAAGKLLSSEDTNGDTGP